MARLRLAALGGAVCLLAGLTPTAAEARSSVVFTGIRPGIALVKRQVQTVNLCTGGFVFQPSAGAFDPEGDLYLGTAAHCYALNQTVHALVVPPGEDDAVLLDIGTVSHRFVAEDVALILIHPELNEWVSPSVAHWGGPTGTYASGQTTLVTHTGHGLGTGPGGSPRAGQLTIPGGDTFYANALVAVGDSGSPFLTASGLAVGHLFKLDLDEKVVGEQVGIVGWGPAVDTIVGLTGMALATCPSRTPWPAPGCPPV